MSSASIVSQNFPTVKGISSVTERSAAFGAAGGVPDVRLDDGQDNPVRLVPGSVDVIRPRRGFGIRLDLQGKGVMI